jgi:diacylglycerol kinase family enzyme
MQAELIYNPRGGQVVVRNELKAVMTFLARYGWTVTYRETTGPGEATELACNAAREGANVVVAAGGDGTVSEVANGLLHTDTAMGVLPVGTTNSWALQMGIPALHPFLPGTNVVKMVTDLEQRIARPVPANYYRKVLLDAAKVLVEGRTVAVDMGEVSGRYFLMWAGIGLDATVLRSIPPKEKKMLGSWAYLATALGIFGRCPSTAVRLSLDGNIIETNTPLIVISNIQLYGGMMAIGAKARVNDGKLDVCVFKGQGFFTFVQHSMKILSHQHLQDPKIEYHQSSEIIVESADSLPMHVDGEPFAKTPVSIHSVPSALKVIVPQNASASLFSP